MLSPKLNIFSSHMHCVPFCLLAVSWNSFFPSCLIPPFPEVVAEMPLLFYFLATPSDMWDLSSMTRHQTGAPCVETHSFDHWTAREVPVPPPEGSLPHPSEEGLGAPSTCSHCALYCPNTVLITLSVPLSPLPYPRLIPLADPGSTL